MVSEGTSLGCRTDLWAPRSRMPSTLVHSRGWDDLSQPLRAVHAFLGTVQPMSRPPPGWPRAPRSLKGIHDTDARLLPDLEWAACGTVFTGTWPIAMAHGGDALEFDSAAGMLLDVAAD